MTSGYGVALTVAARLGGAYDGIVVPGGPWDDPGVPGVAAELARGELVDAIARVAPAARWIASVCTGAFLLRAAGLLGGGTCTTHTMAVDDLRAAGADVVVGPRVVDAGRIVSSAGITSGLDLGVHLVRRELGDEVADTVAQVLEYAPLPAGAITRPAAAGDGR